MSRSGGWNATVTDDQLSAIPDRFVAELPGWFGPGGVTDGAGERSVAEQVGDGEVFHAKPIVGLDELAGDLVQKLRRTLAMRACSRDSRRIALVWLEDRNG